MAISMVMKSWKEKILPLLGSFVFVYLYAVYLYISTYTNAPQMPRTAYHFPPPPSTLHPLGF